MPKRTWAVAVDDDDILKAENLLASREGAFVCPEGAGFFPLKARSGSLPVILECILRSITYFAGGMMRHHLRFSNGHPGGRSRYQKGESEFGVLRCRGTVNL